MPGSDGSQSPMELRRRRSSRKGPRAEKVRRRRRNPDDASHQAMVRDEASQRAYLLCT